VRIYLRFNSKISQIDSKRIRIAEVLLNLLNFKTQGQIRVTKDVFMD